MKNEQKTTLKIMLTGSHGFVGARAAVKYPHAVIVPSALVRSPGESLAEFVRAYAPDVILNTAAISDIGACARDPEGSYASNVTLPVVLATAAREVGAKLISFSSDQVYTGCTHEGPYSESEILPTPTNLYARHKLEAEGRVLEIAPDAICLRATWMYDMPLYRHANRENFLTQMLSAIMERRPQSFFDDDFRGITYVRQVVELFDKLPSLPGGVYNYGSENPLSMYETACAFASAFGLSDIAEALIVRRSDGAPHHNLWMDCSKLASFGVRFDTTAEGFSRCYAEYMQAFSHE